MAVVGPLVSSSNEEIDQRLIIEGTNSKKEEELGRQSTPSPPKLRGVSQQRKIERNALKAAKPTLKSRKTAREREEIM